MVQSESDLNAAQREVATHRGGPLLVFAAAGTGKTQALTARIAHIISHDGVPPEKVLALTFTRKAAGEMRTRAAALCGIDESRLRNVGTFHSLCVRILRTYGFYIPPSSSSSSSSSSTKKNRLDAARFTILEPEQIDAMLDELLMDALSVALRDHCSERHGGGNDSHQHRRALEEATKVPNVRRRIDAWRDRGLDPDDPQVLLEGSESLLGRVAMELYPAYREVCARRNVVDFGDLILHACATLEKVPGALEDCRRNAYAHILVDEFQDTNPAQMRLVRILVRSDQGSHPRGLAPLPLMVVGDDYQAIHEWRGATVRNILEFTREFPDARTVFMHLNYRSVPSVLEAARNVISKNSNQRHKVLEASRPELAGGGSVFVVEFASPQEEGEKIAEEIHRLCYASNASNASNASSQPRDFAILYRANAHSQPLEQALRTRGIPYRLRGGARSFFERSEIKDAMAYARLLLNPRSDMDFERAIHVPHRGVGEATMERLRLRMEGEGEGDAPPPQKIPTCLMDAARAEASFSGCPKNRREALATFVSLFDSREELPPRALRECLEAAGYLTMVREERGGIQGGRHENVKALLELAERQDAHESLRDFVDACSLAEEETLPHADEAEKGEDGEQQCEDDNCVTLMTMHASKGLEFKAVYVAGFAEGSLPHAMSVIEGKIEEERRLCYVAITRARDRLTLCVPRSRTRFGNREETAVSRFLAETGLSITKSYFVPTTNENERGNHPLPPATQATAAAAPAALAALIS